MPDIFTYILFPVIVATVLYIGKFLFERKISKRDEEIKRIKRMLTNLSKLRTAANIPGQTLAYEATKEVSDWFEADCWSFRNKQPYKRFNHLAKKVSAYTKGPDIMASQSLNIFEELTSLEEELDNMLKIMRI